MDRNDVILTLNHLIEISRDGEYGFRTSANSVRSAHLKPVFEEAAHRCAEGAQELEGKVRSLGGTPSHGGSVAGSLHRGWVNLKSVITGMDEGAILEECEHGEDAARKAYEGALEQGLPADVRSIVERQYQGVKENHDRVRELRNTFSRAG